MQILQVVDVDFPTSLVNRPGDRRKFGNPMGDQRGHHLTEQASRLIGGLRSHRDVDMKTRGARRFQTMRGC